MFLGRNFDETVRILREKMQADRNFDLIFREIVICGKRSVLVMLDGFTKDEVVEKILEFFFSLENKNDMRDAKGFSEHCVPYCETALSGSEEEIICEILSGQLALLVEGFDRCILIDTRTYPQRPTSEPEKDKSFRGSHDGCVEPIVFNTSLLRRRIRTPDFCVEHHRVCSKSKTDIALCYLSDKVDQTLLSAVQDRLTRLNLAALTMNGQSLAEALFPSPWFNPFPKVRFTERPDTAAAQIYEGNLIILVDNSPSALILPVHFWDLFEEANDYYFLPITGSYLRQTRILVCLITLVLTPLWLLALQYPGHVPEWLSFILDNDAKIPIFAQLLLLELIIDGMDLASLSTPNVLITSLSMVGAVILGDFGVKSGWFTPDALLYMAFITVSNFSVPSLELGYALKFSRLLLLIAVRLFRFRGFVGMGAALFLFLLFSRGVDGKGYLYPLLPFRAKALKNVLLRGKTKGGV